MTKNIDNDNPLLFFNYKKFFFPSEVKRDGTLYTIKLLPHTDNDENFEIKYCDIVCDDKFIHQVNIFNEDETKMNVHFSGWQRDIKCEKKFFFFDVKRRGLRVISLD